MAKRRKESLAAGVAQAVESSHLFLVPIPDEAALRLLAREDSIR